MGGRNGKIKKESKCSPLKIMSFKNYDKAPSTNTIT